MKIVGRILIILAVLALVMGITYVIVNTRGSSAPGFEPGNERFSASNGAPPGFPEGGRPEFPGGGRNEFRGERGERGGGGWLLEALKNIAIIGIIVALIVVPKSWMQKRKKATQTPAG
jgi:hypothetical protein